MWAESTEPLMRMLSTKSIGIWSEKDLYEKSKDFNNTSLEVIHGAVTDFEGDTSYHEPLKWSPNSKNYKGGSTLMQDKTNSSNHAISVRAIDLAEWLVKNMKIMIKYL